MLNQNLPANDMRHMNNGVHNKEANKSWIVYCGPDGRPMVTEINHETGEIFNTYVGGYAANFDPHNYPTIVQSGDGTLLVFYADQLANNMRYARSTSPNDATAWSDFSMGLRAEYPMPMVTNDGVVYFFHRKIIRKCLDGPCTGTYRQMYVSISRDNGLTFETPKVMMQSWQMETQMNEFYLDQIVKAEGTPEKWYTTWVMAGGINPSTGQPQHDYYHRNIYAAYFMPSTGHWYSCNDVDLGEFINGGCTYAPYGLSDNMMDKHCIVLNTGTVSKSTLGYYHRIMPGPEIVVDAQYHLKNGQWVKVTPTGITMSNILAGNVKDGKYYLYTGNSVYESTNGIDYTQYASIAISYISGGAVNIVTINDAHPAAQLFIIKLNSNSPTGRVYVAGLGSLVTPKPKVPYAVYGQFSVYVNDVVSGEPTDDLQSAVDAALLIKGNNNSYKVEVRMSNTTIELK